MKNLITETKNLSPRGLVNLVIKGVIEPVIELEIETYGEERGQVCVGCVATQVGLMLADTVHTVDSIGNRVCRAKHLGVDVGWLKDFEHAVDALRCGYVAYYNNYATKCDLPQTTEPDFYLPKLTNESIKDESVLAVWRRYAETQGETRRPASGYSVRGSK